jgi:hypothetical protein
MNDIVQAVAGLLTPADRRPLSQLSSVNRVST